jgi:hypothetical protein
MQPTSQVHRKKQQIGQVDEGPSATSIHLFRSPVNPEPRMIVESAIAASKQAPRCLSWPQTPWEGDRQPYA